MIVLQVLVKQNNKWVVKKEFKQDEVDLDALYYGIETLISYGYNVSLVVTKKP